MKIALASPPYPKSLTEGLYWVQKLVKGAADQQAEIICFPESYLPGYPGSESKQEDRSPEKLQDALDEVCEMARKNSIAIIIPMDWYHTSGIFNLAHVVSKSGEVLGSQTKNQLDPSEENLWVAGIERRLFEINGIKFGITICHEGFRYPESVRWAAMKGAKIVFQPNFTGSDTEGKELSEWGNKDNPYYEKAQMMRAMENTIYFASSNCAFRYPHSASSLIDPDGQCIAYQPYGNIGIIVAEIDPSNATGLLANRFKAGLY